MTLDELARMLPKRDDPARVELGNQIQCQWIADGRVMKFGVQSVGRDAVDTWVGATGLVMHNWDSQLPLLMMHEVEVLPTTAYVKQCGQEVSRRYDYLHGKTATLLKPDLFNKLIPFFTENEVGNINPKVQQRLFTTYHQALEWLLK